VGKYRSYSGLKSVANWVKEENSRATRYRNLIICRSTILGYDAKVFESFPKAQLEWFSNTKRLSDSIGEVFQVVFHIQSRINIPVSALALYSTQSARNIYVS